MTPVGTIRDGSVDDADAVLGLLDRAVAWLVARGRNGQWGDRPWSSSADRVARTRRMVEENETLVVEQDGAVVAALVHGPDGHDYLPPAPDAEPEDDEPDDDEPEDDQPEDYVLLLVADPSAPVRGAGRRLLDESWSRARARGVRRQRVDCYAGDDGALVAFYESAGFTRTATFSVGEWPGQLLERRA